MPCLETMSRHHKRGASNSENEDYYSSEYHFPRNPNNLPSISTGMKRMKIHGSESSGLTDSDVFSSSDLELCNCNSYDQSFERDGHCANLCKSLSSSPCSSYSIPEDIEHLFRLDNQGNNLLHTNILRLDTNASLKLITQTPSFDYLSIENSRGQTALHLAVLTDQPTLVRSLICAGAAVDALDNNSKTPLHLACEIGNTTVVKHLLRPVEYSETLGNRYTIPFQRIPQNMEMTDAEGQTCLDIALASEKVDVAKMLIDSGAFMFSQKLLNSIILRHLVNESSHTDDDSDDNEEEEAKHETLACRHRPVKFKKEANQGNGDQDDHLSYRDFSIVLKNFNIGQKEKLKPQARTQI